jgi:hypothetical protein
VSDNLKDILSNLSKDIDQETLLKYLNNQLPEEKKHEVEKQMLESEFTDDALEGLQQINDKQQIEYMVEMLNRDLKKKTEKKKMFRKKLELKQEPGLYMSIFILILLIIICYMIISKMIKD